MKILLVGNFGARNVGDELILCAALETYPEATVMTNDERFSQSFCETKFKTVPFPPTAFRSFWFYITDSLYRQKVHHIRHFDQVVFVGGGLFSIKFRACFLWWLVFRWLKFLNPAAEFRLEHQGVDKDLDFLSKKLTTMVYKSADFVSVRDQNSKEALTELGVTNITLTEDRAWLWLKALDKTQNFQFNRDPENHLVLVNALAYSHGEIFAVEHSEPYHPVKYIAFAPSDLEFVPLGVDAILPKNKTQVFELFLAAKQAVGERLHFLIVAQVFADETDTVALLRRAYAEKVQSFVSAHDIKVFVAPS